MLTRTVNKREQDWLTYVNALAAHEFHWLFKGGLELELHDQFVSFLIELSDVEEFLTAEFGVTPQSLRVD